MGITSNLHVNSIHTKNLKNELKITWAIGHRQQRVTSGHILEHFILQIPACKVTDN